MFEQPGQAWVHGGLITPLIVSNFQDLPVEFLAHPLVCGSPHLGSQPKARRAKGSQFMVGTSFAYHS